MRLNTDSIEVEHNERLFNTLVKIFKKRKNRPKVVIESGAYLGTGTSAIIADAIVKSKSDILFYTLEGKKENYDQAVENLSKYDFVQVLFGLSVEIDQALEFVSNDPIYKNMDDYDIITDAHDPVAFYRNELWSCIACNPTPPPQNMLSTLLGQYKTDIPLVSLDSCGGIGKLEFDIVRKTMGNNPYYLFCDDIGHCKHFRTYQHIVDHLNEWNILYRDERLVVAEFLGE